jgi:hypothetical protein
MDFFIFAAALCFIAWIGIRAIANTPNSQSKTPYTNVQLAALNKALDNGDIETAKAIAKQMQKSAS